MDKEFNLVAAIRVILKWKTPLFILVIFSGVAAAVFSFVVMDEYYMSWATFYPTNQYLNDRSMIFNTERAGEVNYFGDKGDVNRVLTISNSEPVINYVIDSFKLVEHYKVDTTEKYWRTKVRKEFESNYEAIKTEKEAVEITLYDTDPQLAAKIINAITAKVDELNKYHIDNTKKELFDVLSQQISEQQQKVHELVDTLSSLAELYNIKLSLAAGSTVLVAGNDFKALVSGNNFKAVQEYKALIVTQENALKELNNRLNIRDQMEVAMNNKANSLYIVEQGFAADKKAKPVRWQVVSITMLVTAFVSLIGIFLIEQINDLRKQLQVGA